MNRSLLIVGGGGHGKVVADVVRNVGYEIAGYVDADSALQGKVVEPNGTTVIATQDALLERVAAGATLPGGAEGVALGMGDNYKRIILAEHLAAVDLPALVHRSAIVSPSVRTGRGTLVCPCVVINADATLGQAVIVNSAAVVEHDCVICDGVHISPGAVLASGVHVGRCTWIGAGATVIQGVRVGSDVTVGAGAVVIRDVPDGQTVVGCPAAPLERQKATSGLLRS